MGNAVKDLFPLSLCLVLSLSVSACLSSILGSKESRSKDYSIPKPGKGWEVIDPAEADAAYRNKVDQAILNVSSVCGEDRFRSLEALTQDVLRQLPQSTLTQGSEARTIDGHPGMVTSAEGQVDGEKLRVKLAVIRTPKCLYDIILAGPELDSSSLTAFEAAVGGFRERSSR